MSEQTKLSSVFRDQECSVISNPINDTFFADPNRSVARGKLAIHSNDFVAVVIAKDLRDPNKNLDFIMKALEQASTGSERSLTLLLVGKNGGSYSSPRVNVKWLGELSAVQMAEIAGAADSVLSASIAESAGMTIVECAAKGIPAVAIENGGTASLIINGETGFLARDLESFAASVETLAKDNFLLEKFGNAAQQKANGHKPDQIANSYINLYKSMG
jgi:glycosyltransferase involved in cell wall biosynthesis